MDDLEQIENKLKEIEKNQDAIYELVADRTFLICLFIALIGLAITQ